MNNSGYPAGADTGDAPWNKVSPKEEIFNMTVSQTLSKTVEVYSNDYVEEEESYLDTSNINWEEEYHNNDHYTPDQLLVIFKRHLEQEIRRFGDTINVKQYRHWIKECDNWIVDESEYIES